MRLGLSLGLANQTVAPAGGAALPTSAELDFSGVGDVNPYAPPTGWTLDRSADPFARIASGRWTGTATNGGQSIHADEATLDLDGVAEVYVEATAAIVSGSNTAQAIALMGDYEPGAHGHGNVVDGSMTGYRLQWSSNAMELYRVVGGAGTLISTVSILEFMNVARNVRLEADVGGDNVTLRVYVDASLWDTTVDSDETRVAGLRTIAAAVGDTSGSSIGSMAALSGGVRA